MKIQKISFLVLLISLVAIHSALDCSICDPMDSAKPSNDPRTPGQRPGPSRGRIVGLNIVFNLNLIAI